LRTFFLKKKNRNEAVAVINSVVGNTIGVFVSPLLIFLLAGRSSSVDLGKVLILFFKKN